MARIDDIAYAYTGRRTVAAELVREVTDLCRLLVDEHAHDVAARLEAQSLTHATEVGRLADEADRLRADLQDARDTIAARRRVVEESREIDDLSAAVTLKKPDGGWTIASLEEVAYRLRSAGGGDHTAVTVYGQGSTVVAKVPAPNMVHLEPRPPAEPVEVAPSPDLGRWRPTPLIVALWLASIVVVAALGVIA